jgi:cytochrome c oxidase assembly factor CtaG
MTWWCSATGEPWTWEWRAYPGVWLFILLLALGYWFGIRRKLPASERRPVQLVWFAAALVAIWLALDWPIGALGAGYLASFHALSYILLALIAPPCVLLAIPADEQRRLATESRWAPLLRLAGRPWAGLTVYAGVLVLTHFPGIVDGAMRTQLGAFAIDLAWLVSGFALWWPVMGPSPEVVRIRRPLKMAYLFLATLPTIGPSAFLTFADYPLYATYELAPRIFRLMTALEDQKVAGLLMKIVGDLPLWLGFGVIFFRWAHEEKANAPVHPGAPRD